VWWEPLRPYFKICVYDLATSSTTGPCAGTILRDSAAAGSHHMGVVIHADDCTAATRGVEGLVGHVVAHSTRAGFLALGRPGAACAGLAGFTSHHTVEVGVTLPYNSGPKRVEVMDAVIADATPIGISMPLSCSGDHCEATIQRVRTLTHEPQTP